MFRRRQIAAENDRIGTLLDERRQRIDQGRQFRVGFSAKLLGALNQCEKRWVGLKIRAWFDVHAIFVVPILVVNLGFQPIAFV
ncbi:MAG: hypothetical protein WAS73_14400 [Defluviicoccus sp.]